jgi:hypothetical protein
MENIFKKYCAFGNAIYLPLNAFVTHQSRVPGVKTRAPLKSDFGRNGETLTEMVSCS